MTYYREVSFESLRISSAILLENDVVIRFDALKELAYGSDGKVYYPVCRIIPGDSPVTEDLETLGWSCEITGEVILPAV